MPGLMQPKGTPTAVPRPSLGLPISAQLRSDLKLGVIGCKRSI